MTPPPHPPHTATARRRGSVFVLVLGVTSLVTVIGLSAMVATRLQHRGSQDRVEAAQAQQLADSALQVVHARLDRDASWRTRYTHNAWSSPEAIGPGGGFSFKLVDARDTNLANDPDHPVRLYVRATHGSAVRLVSVELRSGATLGPELLTNGDMEAGASGFSTNRGGSLEVHTDSPRGGARYLQHAGGTSSRSLRQSLMGKVSANKTYRITGWMRGESSAATAKLGIFYALLLISGDYSFTAPIGTSWTYVKGDVTPALTLLPTTLALDISTNTTSQDIHVDDLSVRELLSTSLPVVQGSYRRELDE